MLAEKAMDDEFQGLKVMVIDDSKTIRRTAETLLKKVGCEVITATDGFEALAKIVKIEGDEALSQAYPARWPARVTVVTADGQRLALDVPDVPGDAATPLDWEEVETKCTTAGVPADALDQIERACRVLPEAGGTAELRAAVTAAMGVVDFTKERAIR